MTEKPKWKKKIEDHFEHHGYNLENLPKLNLWEFGTHAERLYLWTYFGYLIFTYNDEEYGLFTNAHDIIQPFFRDIIDFKDEKAIKNLEITRGIKINKLPPQST